MVQNPGEIKSREVELGSHSWVDCLAAELFLNSCFSDSVFVTSFRTAVETAISGVRKLLRTGGVLTSSAWLFWRWLTVSSVFTGRSARTNYSCPFSVPNKRYGFCGRERRRKKTTIEERRPLNRDFVSDCCQDHDASCMCVSPTDRRRCRSPTDHVKNCIARAQHVLVSD